MKRDTYYLSSMSSISVNPPLLGILLNSRYVKMTPAPHRSIFSLYYLFCCISGAMKSLVPFWDIIMNFSFSTF